MTKEMMDWFISELKAESLPLAQVEPYEGQFDDPDDSSVFPPSALVMVGRSENTAEGTGQVLPSTNVSVFLTTNHVHGTDPGTMLAMIDSVVALLHDRGVRYETQEGPANPPTQYVGRCFWANTEPVPVYQGMSTYVVNFNVRLSQQRG